MKRAQVTIFFAIGLVLLIIFGLIIYVATLGPPEEDTRRASTQAQQYLATCLDNAMYDALDELGAQGGAFHDNMLNDLDTVPHKDVGGTPVSYGIMRDYSPWQAIETYDGQDNLTFYLSKDTNSNGIDDGMDPTISYISTFFGVVTLPALCEPDGPNSRSQDTDTHCGPYAYERKEPFPAPSEHTIQGALTKKLTRALDLCIQEGDEDRLGTTNIYNNPAVTVTFGERAINVDASFPGAPEAAISADYDVRLLPLYNYVTELLNLETRDYRFPLVDKDTGYPRSSPYYRFGFSIQQELTGNDLIYTFEDTNPTFQYRNTQFALRFVVQDRKQFTDGPPEAGSGDPDSY